MASVLNVFAIKTMKQGMRTEALEGLSGICESVIAAVVATEIGKLAGETSNAVDQIQSTIVDVQGAFDKLTHDSQSLLEFVTKTVTPDYNSFVDVAKQYGIDADSIKGFSEEISSKAENIERIMNEVGDAVQNIAESSQSTADNSSMTMQSVNNVSKVVEDVSNMSTDQQSISLQLSEVVNKFKL